MVASAFRTTSLSLVALIFFAMGSALVGWGVRRLRRGPVRDRLQDQPTADDLGGAIMLALAMLRRWPRVFFAAALLVAAACYVFGVAMLLLI